MKGDCLTPNNTPARRCHIRTQHATMRRMNDQLFNISPLDGRYSKKTKEYQSVASEYALMRYRLQVEATWLKHLQSTLPELAQVDKHALSDTLTQLLDQFDEQQAKQIKQIEAQTNHDVKAVEYYLQQQLSDHPALHPFIHFGLTSEDVNNCAYALMQHDSRKLLQHRLANVLATLQKQVQTWQQQPMLCRTHGQPASPSTIGKELANFEQRLRKQSQHLMSLPIEAKLNGAVGNYNALVVAYPEIDWISVCSQFIEQLGLQPNLFTTQIEPHDSLANLLYALCGINSIAIDLSRDLWGYISLNYFKQKTVVEQVGSSTMPHKVNPIDFENAEGNFGMSSSLATHLAQKLPISRWQRDLSDSTVLRNLGSVFAYSDLALQSLNDGLNKLELNSDVIDAELDSHWEILAEAIQTVMRSHGISDAYEQLKAFTRGKATDKAALHAFIEQTELPDSKKTRLKQLKPSDYTGLAETLCNQTQS